MIEELDYIARFARTKNFEIRPRTIFVEGTTDVDLFELAARLEKERTGLDLLGDKLAIIAAGERDYGGVAGVGRELVSFKNMAGSYLLSNGRPKYRFVGLFDNDKAGRQGVHNVRRIDTSILEFKDVFCLWPVMPLTPNRDPGALRKSFESENEKYKGLDWELEDLIPLSLTSCFLEEFPAAEIRSSAVNDKVHHEWTADGKARLHHFVKQYAMHEDLGGVITVLRALWYYLGIRLPDRV